MSARVVLADDHVPTRLAVRAALEQGGFDVVGEAATVVAAVLRVGEVRPEVALLDVRMTGGGLTAAREIAEQFPATVVVMLTVSRDDADLFEALRAGARGYLLKDIDPDRLPHALRGVLDGEAALPRSLVSRLIEEFRARDRDVEVRRDGPLATLTDREWETLDRLAQGRSTQQIAQEMFVAPVTVRTYVAAILRKLHVPDRDAAVRLLKKR